MKRIAWLGVVVGGITDIVLTNILTLPVAVYAMVSGGILSLPKAQQQTAMITLLHASVGLYAATAVIGCACSVLAGYVAAWLAKPDEVINGALSAFLCVAFDLYAMTKGVAGSALWFVILLLPASPLLGALGGYLRVTQRRQQLRLRSN